MQFDQYSSYYDLLYRDKDYAGEAAYVYQLIKRFTPACQNLLELGCGTGRHAQLLSEHGLQVTGVEISRTMLCQAQARVQKMNESTGNGAFTALLGDARTIRTNRKFDSVISLFHVVSYQTTNDDVLAIFTTAAEHLNSQGTFIFDVWYGPAVLDEKPIVRVKRMEDEEIAVIRIAQPSLYSSLNRVDVQYTILVKDKTNQETCEFSETHRMRYFFQTEIELLAKLTGFEFAHSEEWLTSASPSSSTWGVTFCLRKL